MAFVHPWVLSEPGPTPTSSPAWLSPAYFLGNNAEIRGWATRKLLGEQTKWRQRRAKCHPLVGLGHPQRPQSAPALSSADLGKLFQHTTCEQTPRDHQNTTSKPPRKWTQLYPGPSELPGVGWAFSVCLTLTFYLRGQQTVSVQKYSAESKHFAIREPEGPCDNVSALPG